MSVLRCSMNVPRFVFVGGPPTSQGDPGGIYTFQDKCGILFESVPTPDPRDKEKTLIPTACPRCTQRADNEEARKESA